MTPEPGPVIEPDEAHAMWSAGEATFVDGTWTLTPGGSPDATAKLPGAVRFDLNQVSDGSSCLPHMAPDAGQVADWARAVGLPVDCSVVIYDDNGMFSSPRVWWTLRHAGWRNVRVLNGGRPAWIAAGLPLEGQATATREARDDRRAAAPPRRLASAGLKTVQAAVAAGGASIVDARPADRFLGRTPEPRPGLRGGAMPGARNVPYTALTDGGGRLKAPDDIKSAFEAAGVDLDGEVIATCGSGVTAAIVILALETIGHRRHRLYDGSWAEWGAPDPAGKRPVVTQAGNQFLRISDPWPKDEQSR
ncbi:MAG: sulfurtransferase [Alphaproteobacteria bacterium]|nr:sulfurtransferase [Alphaproteobacteria bacterium]